MITHFVSWPWPSGRLYRGAMESKIRGFVHFSNLFRGQLFEGINFSEWKGNANIPLLAVPRILTTIPPTVTSHTCMVSTGCPFFFCNFFASLYVIYIVVFR